MIVDQNDLQLDPSIRQCYVHKLTINKKSQQQKIESDELISAAQSIYPKLHSKRNAVEQFKTVKRLNLTKLFEQNSRNQCLYETMEPSPRKIQNQLPTTLKKKKNPYYYTNQSIVEIKDAQNFLKAYDEVAFIKKIQEKANQKYVENESKQHQYDYIKLTKLIGYGDGLQDELNFGLKIRKLDIQQTSAKSSKRFSPQLSKPRTSSTMSRITDRSTIVHKTVRNMKVLEFKNIPSIFKKAEYRDNIFEEKCKKYRQFIFKIYFAHLSYHEIKDLQSFEKKKYKRYQAVVMKGNNSNLIVSLLKKRWWWTISTELSSETNFLWTQLKVLSFIHKQRQNQYTSPSIKKPDRILICKEENAQGQDSSENCLKIMHKNDYELYKQYLTICKHEPFEFKSRIKYSPKQNIGQFGKPQKVHNHFQFNNFIGNKKALLKNMIDYYIVKSVDKEYYNIPMTFHIKNNRDKELKKFQEFFKQKQKSNNKKNVWIIKPGENSNRGRGIQVSRNLKQILSIINDQSRTHIVQQYLCSLFLYNKRKFDIRTYCLVTQVNGILKAYWYQEGYIRTSSEIYRLDDLSDPMIHLTNDAIQKYGQNYGKYEPGNKISYQDLQKYLEANYSQQKFSMSKLVSNMKTIATEVIFASYFKIDPKCRQNNFEIFGLDFIVDKDFRPWLLEVNTNPCLQLSCPLLERIIPTMVENSFKIGLDPLFPPTPCPYTSRPYMSDHFAQKNRFELIFDSQYDRNLELQNIKFEQQQEMYEDEAETYQNQGQQLLDIKD